MVLLLRDLRYVKLAGTMYNYYTLLYQLGFFSSHISYAATFFMGFLIYSLIPCWICLSAVLSLLGFALFGQSYTLFKNFIVSWKSRRLKIFEFKKFLACRLTIPFFIIFFTCKHFALLQGPVIETNTFFKNSTLELQKKLRLNMQLSALSFI